MRIYLILATAVIAAASLGALYHSITVRNLQEAERLAVQRAQRAEAKTAAAKAAQRAEDSLGRAQDGNLDAREEMARRVREAKR